MPACRNSGTTTPSRRHSSALLAAICLGSLLLLSSTATHGATGDWRQWEIARAQVHAARIAELEQERPASFNFRTRLAAEQAAVCNAQQALASNAPPPVLTGLQLEAYLCASDDSAQPFSRYLPSGLAPTSSPPLLVFLHGYNPAMGLSDDPYIPAVLTNLAEACGACIAAPFGRCNTDFQGIGEQDVIRVIEEMQARHHTDPQRVVLSGHSMGGLGTWCIGARHPERFNGLFVLSGRGDFYTWHSLAPADLPPWQRRLVDMQFAAAWSATLSNLPVFAAHGMRDDLVAYREGLAIFNQVRPHDPHALFLAFPGGGHGIVESTLCQEHTRAWLLDVLSTAKPRDPPTGLRIGETGSQLQNALLQPFVFIGGSATNRLAAEHTLADRAGEWKRFTRSAARTALEPELSTNLAAACHLFVFGEPETSPLTRRILEASGVKITPDTFQIAGRTLPRANHGLWFTGTNPFTPQRLGIVQCGIPWGEHLPDNHRYDRIPDVIVYAPEADRWGINQAVAAGFRDAQGCVQWFDPPVTPAILCP